MKKSGEYDDTLFLATSEVPEPPAIGSSDASEQYDQLIDELESVRTVTPQDRPRALQRARKSLSSLSGKRSAQEKAYVELLNYNRMIDRFKAARFRVIDTFMLSLAYTPCKGRRIRRYGPFRIRRQELCNAQVEIQTRVQLRAIIATDKKLIRALGAATPPSVAFRRYYSGEYGI